ncbi:MULTISPECIES: carbohydrate ABC transporter permease [Cytobacillus]|uniref:carbohydrate ABC transporter permease n=1 Tax=Cytobacillus TaxID=2675230 RepID=UPI001CD70465|nr:carbohydrate ABC transporter permease [Cytobacillus kochii]MCA1024690.1 carbohydrate ABC transporter permease [Cytobacillus kochii]MCM3323317.1 carbohydrate ABC transporter permease [Cytobacillus kochii]MCM3345712.1 carbohydrate ABC transporter permease [Cytobacillus kochii]
MTIGKKILLYLVLILSGFIMFFPIVYAFMISFMQGGEVLQGKLIPENFTLTNYLNAFEKVPLLRYLINSLVVSTVIMLGQLLLCSLAAFAFVFTKFKGKNLLFMLFISTMMIPWEATMVPNFQTIQSLGWLNSFPGLTIPFFAMAFGTFLLRQQFKTIPIELYEASQVSGVSRFKFFLTVVLPISKTSLITLGIYCFLTAWNMYLWPLLVTNDEKVRTVQIGLKQMQTQEIASEWGVVMAGVMLVILPTLLLIFVGQKRLQEGLTRGAIK